MMKSYILFLCSLIIYSSILLGQDKYPRPLEEVDLSKIWYSTPGIIPENNMTYDPIIADIINQTNLDSLISYVRILSGEDSVQIGGNKVLIQNRGGNGGNLAADYIKQKLSSYNLEVYEQDYSSTGKNVYAVQEGYLYPEKQYIICAHYDGVDIYCADDNASGVAAIIEAARILSGYDFKYTLIYAFWDEEEIGLTGSNYYASQASSNQDDIQGVLNMDMLAWDGNNDNLLDIHTQNTANSNDLANLMVVVNYLYGLSLNPVIYNPGTWQSDHSSFWNYDYGAILLIEAYYGNDLNPYYHTVNDRIDKFNLSYFHNLSRLAVGTASTLGEATNDTFLVSITPNIGYQTYPVNVEIKGVNTHFQEGSGTQQVWFSKGQETITADNFTVMNNTSLNAYFQIPASASAGNWNVNVQCSVDGVIIKEEGFSILPPPAIIVVNPDSIVVGVLPGSTKTQTLTISNDGETNLNFNVIGGYSSNNYALQFDGVDDYVHINNSLNILPLTVEIWFGMTALATYANIPDGVYLFSNDLPGNHGFGICISKDDNYLGIQRHDAWEFSNIVVPLLEWHHASVVYQDGQFKLFWDGTLVLENSYEQPSLNGMDYFWVGGNTSEPLVWQRFFTGIIDEVRLWNIPRSQSEIYEYMNKPLTGSENGLIGYWQFNEGIGNTALDKTINANNGTLSGGVQWTTSTAPIMPGWFQISLDSGVCSPHTSMDIELFFDATEVDTGDYFASIIIKSSDPFTPNVTVPIHMIVSSTVGTGNESDVPLVFNLEQNYPNPFNPVTIIKYSIPEPGKVKLTLFNLLGEEVAVLINEEKNVGNYSVEFSAAELPSGVYFYKLQAGDYIAVKKMLLLK